VDLPNLPTESLYKFQALAGLLLTIGSLVYVFKLIDAAMALAMEIELEIKLLKNQANSLKPSLEWLEFEIGERRIRLDQAHEVVGTIPEDEDSADGLSKRQIASDLISELKGSSKELVDSLSLLEGKVYEKEQVRIRLEGKQKSIAYQWTKVKLLAIAGAIAFVIGLSLCLVGFHRWQVVQDDIDTAIHKQAKN
jgi:hypothetical protein